jgi:hypothetical protein
MDFLVFKSFISIPVFMVLYYVGVIIIPLLALVNKGSLLKLMNVFEDKYRIGKSKFLLIMMLLFILFQIMWRVLFEMIIGYFQMHDYLQQLTS